MIQSKIEFQKQEFKVPKNGTYFGSVMGLMDIYYQYPYKDKHTKFTPLCSNDEIIDHKYKLTYTEWRTIIRSYIKHILIYIAMGKGITLPSGFGKIKLIRYPSTTTYNWGATNKLGKRVKHRNMIWGGQFFKMRWQKSKIFFSYQMWHVRLVKKGYETVLKELRDNPSNIYNLDTK